MACKLKINGEPRETAAEGLTPLVDVLRDEFALLGAKPVCREGFCGACTVLLDDRPVMSCLIPVGIVAGCCVETIESRSANKTRSALQQALEHLDVVQCGMCFPGMIMTLSSFIDERPSADRDDIKAALAGNICRCTGYERIVDAALTVARAR